MIRKPIIGSEPNYRVYPALEECYILWGKGRKAPFVILTAILLFGRKRPPEENRPTQTLQPTPDFPIPDVLKKTVTTVDASKARDRLRIASLERDIIGDALTKIYEAEAKGQLTEPERNQLVQRYKVDLKRVDGDIDTHKRVVDLHELESAKEDLLKSFHEKLLEIDQRINQIKPSVYPFSELEPKTVATETAAAPPTPARPDNSGAQAGKEKPAREKPRNKAEERLEAMREEVLKAMERLEQIETEG